MRPWLTLVLVGACYSPTPSPGAPCGEKGVCPTGLVCALDGRCELPGGGSIDAANAGDAPMLDDGPRPVDAKPADATPLDAFVTADASSTPTCWNAWRSGAPVLSAPAAVTELASSLSTLDPTLSSDGLTIYFSRGASGNADLFTATRATRTSPFGASTAVAELNSTNDDLRLTVSADGLTGIFSRRVSSFDINLYQVTRAAVSDPWGTPTTMPFPLVDDINYQLDPELSVDGLVLYYSQLNQIGTATQIIGRVSRTAITAIFGTPSQLAITGATGAVADPVPSPDELALVYTNASDLYLATRAVPSGSFSSPIALTAVNSTANDGDAELSRDGCELFFSSDRVISGTRAIYRATVTPQ
jgi:hypothetical protein